MDNFDKRICDAMHLARRSGFSATAKALEELIANQSKPSEFITQDSSNFNTNAKDCFS